MSNLGKIELIHRKSGRKIDGEMRFSKPRRFYLAALPDTFTQWVSSKQDGQSKIIAQDYEECVDLGQKLFTEFCEATVSQENVIGYRIAIWHDGFNGRKLTDKNFRFKDTGLDHNVGVEFKIFWRINIGGEFFLCTKSFEESDEENRLFREKGNVGYQHYKFIPYNEENHNFFVSVCTTLDALAEKIDDFFGFKPETLLENMKNSKLLIGQ